MKLYLVNNYSLFHECKVDGVMRPWYIRDNNYFICGANSKECLIKFPIILGLPFIERFSDRNTIFLGRGLYSDIKQFFNIEKNIKTLEFDEILF